MRLLKKRSTGFYLSCVLLLTLAISSFGIVYADSGPGTADINAGSLKESNATNMVSLQLKKTIQWVSYGLPIVVTDARGSGGGWNLAITSTRFTITNDKDGNKDQLPATASNISGVNVACDANSTCTKPGNGVSYPLVIPAGNTPPPPVKFFNAAVSTGLGQFAMEMIVNVQIPLHTEPGIYISTIILTIANGP
ncbi:MAG: hypothetical protein PVS3B1_39240 [Ktedonobacteraceae bacterium]